MRKIISLFALFILLTAACFAFEPEDGTLLAEETPEYNGYIVSVKNAFADGTAEAALLGEGVLFSEGNLLAELSEEEFVEFIDENVDGTSTVIKEIGMMKVDDEETLQMLKDSGLVVSYEPDYKMYLMGYDYEKNPGFSYQWGHTAIKSQYAWNAGVFGKGVRVAVIDSGVYPHRDIASNLAPGRSYVDKMDENVDSIGHGTFVAGIIAAQCNSYETVGLAHGATIVPFKVTDEKSFDMSKAILAMYDAVIQFDCDVINMSLGTPSSSDELKRAVDYIVSRSTAVILVAAAGNAGTTAYSYPASYDLVVSVANAEKTQDGYIIRSTSQHNDKVNVAAPGAYVYSLNNSNSGYKYGSGTSFACPYVSAAAALVKSILPGFNQEQFNLLISNYSDDSYITEQQGTDYWGAGLLDVEMMIKAALSAYCYGVNQGDFYMSPPETEEDTGNTSVYITSIPLSPNYLSKAKLVAYNYLTTAGGATRLNRIKFVPVNLKAYNSMEVSLTDLGLDGDIKYSLISENINPLTYPVRTFSFED